MLRERVALRVAGRWLLEDGSMVPSAVLWDWIEAAPLWPRCTIEGGWLVTYWWEA